MPHPAPPSKIRLGRLIVGLLVGSAVPPLASATPAADPASRTTSFDVPAGNAEQTLKLFTQQSGEQILYPPNRVAGVRTNAVKGDMAADAALHAMLAHTSLVAIRDEQSGAFTIRLEAAAESAEKNGDRATATQRGRPAREAMAGDSPDANRVLRLDSFEVFGRKTLNMDLPRSRDDAQPYVVFDRRAITNSGASNLEDFLRLRLTMETTNLTESQTSSLLGARSSINLRGLGPDQTLILVDGHRLAGVMAVGSIYQPDVNGIPLEAIERIEVLPTSASGIYGGGATGGVINIILRRDYSGAAVKVTYGNTFSTDAATRRIDVSAGVTLQDGRTNLLLAASASDGNRLLAQDRDLLERGIARILAHYPAFFYDATYPPFGTTTNIRSANGSDLVLKNGTPLNSPRTYVPTGYAGPAGDQGAALVSNAGQYNFETAQTISTGLRPLLNTPRIESLTLTARHEFSEQVQGFLELSGANNTGTFSYVAMPSNFTLQANNPNNPFTQAIRILTPLYGVDTELQSASQDRRLVAGLIAKLPADWTGEFDYSLDRSRFTSVSYSTQGGANAAVASGELNLLRDTRAYPVDFSPYVDEADTNLPTHAKVSTFTLRASGPVGTLPAGAPVLSGLVERRREVFDPAISLQGDFFSGTPDPQVQTVRSAYLEARVPLVSKTFGWPGLQELELQLATRWDDYSSDGTNFAIGSPTVTHAHNTFRSINPTIGLRAVVNPSVMLRISYGTGFRPPSITDLVSSSFDFFGFYTDPRRGNETLGSFTYAYGGNSRLGPERSSTWSAGLVLTPAAIPGLRLSADWTRIAKTDNITEPDPADLITYESLFPGRITRGPVPPGDPYGVGPITRIDGSAINISRAEIESIDASLDYTRTTGIGRVDFFALATVARRFRTQLLPGFPYEDHVGRGVSQSILAGSTGYPVHLRGNAGVVLTRGRVKAGWSVRYIDSYLIDDTYIGPAYVLAQGNGGRVDAQWYHDCFVSITLGRDARTEVTFNVRNVLNTEPAFDASNSSTYYSGYGDPRLASYSVSIKHQF